MIRRPILDWDDWGNPNSSHVTTPRKRGGWMGANQNEGTINTLSGVFRVEKNDPLHAVIGRKLLPLGETPAYMWTSLSKEKNIVAEEYIGLIARPNIYRIIYTLDGVIRSKPDIHYVPNRINLLVDSKTDVIIDVIFM